MNRKSIITALLTLVVAVVYAQQVMLADSISKNPVGYATIYDADGTVVGRSDVGGRVRLKKGLEYHFSHIGYEPKSLVFDDDSIVFLSR